MSSREQRYANRVARQQENTEPELIVDVNNSPNDTFRAEQNQNENKETKEIEELFASKLLNDDEINGSAKKIFNKYNGSNLPVIELVNKMKANGTEHYILKIIQKYPQKQDIVSIGNLTIRIIWYIFDIHSIAEVAFIINSVRDAFIELWTDHVKNIIHIKKYRKDAIMKILQKNSISCRDNEKNVLKIVELKDLLYRTYNIDMHVLDAIPPISARTTRSSSSGNSNNNNSNNTDETNNTNEIIEETNNTDETTQSDNNMSPTQQIIRLNKKDIKKHKKALRSEMMQKLREDKKNLIQLKNFIDYIQSNLEEDILVSTCQEFERIRNCINELLENIDRELILFEAVPRRKSSRYVGRPDFIPDLDKRIKQYNNEKPKIIKMLFEVSEQTRSAMFVGLVNGSTFGVTTKSKGCLWMSKAMQLASMKHCHQINSIWSDFLKNVYCHERANIQTNYELLVLEDKVKALVDVAEQHKIELILNKVKEVELGYLLTRMEDENISINIENEFERDLDENEFDENEFDENEFDENEFDENAQENENSQENDNDVDMN
eukprot:139577_1